MPCAAVKLLSHDPRHPEAREERIVSLFHFHKWLAIGIDKGMDRRESDDPNHPRMVRVTAILYRCDGCGEHKTKIVDGHWDLEQVSK